MNIQHVSRPNLEFVTPPPERKRLHADPVIIAAAILVGAIIIAAAIIHGGRSRLFIDRVYVVDSYTGRSFTVFTDPSKK